MAAEDEMLEAFIRHAYGPGAFSGTSSACPHIAGAATLAWSGYSGYTGAQLRSYLESHVVDMGPGGKDADLFVQDFSLVAEF